MEHGDPGPVLNPTSGIRLEVVRVPMSNKSPGEWWCRRSKRTTVLQQSPLWLWQLGLKQENLFSLLPSWPLAPAPPWPPSQSCEGES